MDAAVLGIAFCVPKHIVVFIAGSTDPVPVNDMKPVCDVVIPIIIMLQVIGMLPYIQIQQRKQILRERGILVGGGDNIQPTGHIHNQPGIAGTEYGQRCLPESIQKCVKAAKDRINEGAAGERQLLTVRGFQV